MSDGIHIDNSELGKLTADLGEARVAPKNLKSAVQFTATLIKKDVAARMDGLWSGLAGSVGYDIEATPDGVTADVGYDKDKAAGPLGNLREFGAPRAIAHIPVEGPNGLEFVPVPGNPRLPLAPHHDLANALEANAGDFEHGIDKAIEDTLKAAGL